MFDDLEPALHVGQEVVFRAALENLGDKHAFRSKDFVGEFEGASTSPMIRKWSVGG